MRKRSSGGRTVRGMRLTIAAFIAVGAALAAGAPAALAETKRLLRAGGLRGSFDDLLELSARAFAGEDGQEGIEAFREKRPARWVPSL